MARPAAVSPCTPVGCGVPGSGVQAGVRRRRLLAVPGDPELEGRLEVGEVLVGLFLGDRAVGQQRVDRHAVLRDHAVDELLRVDAEVLGDLGQALPGVHPDVQFLVGDAEHLVEDVLHRLVTAVQVEAGVAVGVLDELDELLLRGHRGDVDGPAGATLTAAWHPAAKAGRLGRRVGGGGRLRGGGRRAGGGRVVGGPAGGQREGEGDGEGQGGDGRADLHGGVLSVGSSEDDRGMCRPR
ncbi:hypothetical protein O2W15_21450 [Modestobacter sp. VKM Ac-2979]|uniref:hypothetical protein n=1 Tax=unclassified Modestobacter TaxID=2643866 RepID=UPI0022AB9706|nr:MULTISPECIES: hypothetical protein [unclassified Modestobacter]MCZ2814003.1 hypothetical protein [Modestobacter sp. VKM Ac-2979]MCZ2844581.1 hypothetical protein [Modestobacter sp. VKM Ac-2980]